MNEILVAIVGGSAIGVIAGGLFDIIKMKINRKYETEDKDSDFKKTVIETLQIILLDRIKYIGQSYLFEGEVDFDDRRTLNKMHDCYKSLGGNGDADAIMSKVDDLPLKMDSSDK